MYHCWAFEDSAMQTLEPSGSGKVAARAAVGLPPLETPQSADGEAGPEECEVWGPNGVCMQTKKEAEEWRKRRFEKVQIEGTRGLGHR